MVAGLDKNGLVLWESFSGNLWVDLISLSFSLNFSFHHFLVFTPFAHMAYVKHDAVKSV